MSTLIAVNDVSVAFGANTVLEDISFTLSPGKIITLLGPNGAGKSTIVRVVLGLTEPTSGTVTRTPGLTVGYVPQKLYLDPTMPLTVARFLRLKRGVSKVNAAHLTGKPMQRLSGGEMQRVLLARALLARPQLLVLDEPTQGVDVNGQVALYDLITRLRDELNCAVLMVSHDLHLVMAKTDTVLCINRHICCSGEPDVVAAHPEFTAMFGSRAATQIGVYRHHHNHSHENGSAVLSPSVPCCGNHAPADVSVKPAPECRHD